MEAVFFLIGWILPLLVVGYVLWLLTRLTQTVERIGKPPDAVDGGDTAE
ncbi:MAG TPA: hypothetical protein VM324_03170 [Egibacteraceae bacterium]|jgi:hypothetical protein|nr:hypothetical protein [Egibacteraceae bacterium]